MADGLEDDTENAVRERTGGIRSPWFLPITVVLVLGVPLGGSMFLTRVLDVREHLTPLFGLPAGLLAAVSILGHSPGMFRDSHHGQYSLFWVPMKRRTRATCGAIAFLLVAASVVIDCLKG